MKSSIWKSQLKALAGSVSLLSLFSLSAAAQTEEETGTEEEIYSDSSFWLPEARKMPPWEEDRMLEEHEFHPLSGDYPSGPVVPIPAAPPISAAPSAPRTCRPGPVRRVFRRILGLQVNYSAGVESGEEVSAEQEQEAASEESSYEYEEVTSEAGLLAGESTSCEPEVSDECESLYTEDGDNEAYRACVQSSQAEEAAAASQ
jgi:hypothetical protein